MKKSIAISQSNYIPWKGYFDFISRVDEFVLYDDVQYTRRDWRNRNKIKMSNGLKWLTIPVSADYHDNINEVIIADSTWATKHWNTIYHTYKSAPHFKEFSDAIKGLYDTVPSDRLSEINYHFLNGINKILDIDTPLSWSMDYEKQGNKTERLISICKQAGAEIYNVTILDLLFNTGQDAKKYMKF